MKKKVGNIIAILFISGMISYVIVGSILYNSRKNDILKSGNYSFSIINDSFIGRQNIRSFTYQYKIMDTAYGKEFDVDRKFFNNHQLGDTIIIKFLPSKPEKSIIIENKEYKSCMGLPPRGRLEKVTKM